jgi:hypothetical protein
VHDWLAAVDGVTDAMPSPCLACGGRVGRRYPSGWVCDVCEWRIGDVPHESAPPTIDVVYYARRGDRIKIGTSRQPRQRLATIGIDELLALEPGDRVLEHARHARFAHLRLGTGEWFSAGAELLEHVEQLGAGTVDPWHRYALWVTRALP